MFPSVMTSPVQSSPHPIEMFLNISLVFFRFHHSQMYDPFLINIIVVIVRISFNAATTCDAVPLEFHNFEVARCNKT